MDYRLFPLEELAPGEMRSVTAGRLQVVVIRCFDGTLRALNDRCSHYGARLSRGCLQRMVTSNDQGDRVLGSEVVLRCPWHGYEFDVNSGRCVADPRRERVRAYDVRVEDGMVVLDTGSARGQS